MCTAQVLLAVMASM
nr:hypothetical protein [Ornithinicoccus soli]